ncbi:MAG: TIM barrel protein [Synechococcaceae cyanobacterium RM1_1_27]|nr:TIM barrel protein [Synechococcaceae cyanobacterium RM1_1_27]
MVTSILGDRFGVIEAKDGMIGLDLARQHHPDLILLDFVMPKMDGYDTMQAIRAEEALKQIPIIMMSGLKEQVTARIPEPFVGFDFIEIPLLRPDEFNAESHKAALEKAGIGAVCSLTLPKGMHMPFEPEKARNFLFRALEKCEAVGSQYLGGCIGYTLGELTGKPPTEEERQTVVDSLKVVAEEAKKRGIILALEACNRYETYMYNTLADTRDTILATGVDNLKLHADTYHMNIEEEGFYNALVQTADVLDYIHMSESHRGLVGSGNVNWGEIWRGLAASARVRCSLSCSFTSIRLGLCFIA